MALDDDKKEVDGQSFYNEALTGSGTILDDGTYGDPLPDPTVVRGLDEESTSGGRVVRFQGLGDDNAVSNLGKPEADGTNPDGLDTFDDEGGQKVTPAKKSTAAKRTGSGS